ncbi:MAG TPA: HAD family hydrolase [Anaerolineae bacterium]|nr:HAD family hydrolase [Anaerolineae bacterium]HQK13261.1 HAD family hydrolase [Anaerolineae bacterium]
MRVIHWLITDFDRTLTQLFSDKTLRALREKLKPVYLKHGVSQEYLEQIRDPYKMWEQAYRYLQKHYPIQETKGIHNMASAVLTQYELQVASQAKLFPGVAATLEWIGKLGLGCAIVSTNSDSAIKLVLEKNGVIDFVTCVFGRDSGIEMEYLKPHPALVERAMITLNARRECTILVGDSPADMMAGKAAGVFVIGVLSGQTKADDLLQSGAQMIMKDFSSLRNLRHILRLNGIPSNV